MIDEKKIEEAADKFAEKCSGDYIATSNAIEGFKAGVKWLLDNLNITLMKSQGAGEEAVNLQVPKRLYIIDYQLTPCEKYGISDARLNAFPFNTNRGKLVEYLCLDNLWHVINEEPKHKLIIAECSYKGEIYYKSFDLYPAKELGIYKDFIKERRVRRWLYADDLLKGGRYGRSKVYPRGLGDV